MSTATAATKLMTARKGTTLSPETHAAVQIAELAESLTRPVTQSRMAKFALRQNGLALLRGLEEAGKQLAKAERDLRKALLEQLEAGDSCEPGMLLGSIVERTARTPAWKDEAILRAKEAARLRGEKFDALAYVEAVSEATEAKTSRKAKVLDNSSEEE